jgi:hypothetical protein
MDGSVAHRRHRDRRTASASQVSRDLSVRIPRLDSYIERYPKRHPGNGNVWGSNPAHHGDAVADVADRPASRIAEVFQGRGPAPPARAAAALAVDHVLAADDRQGVARVQPSLLQFAQRSTHRRGRSAGPRRSRRLGEETFACRPKRVQGISERARSTREAVACLWSGLEATLGAGVRGSEMAGRGAALWFGSDAGSVGHLHAAVSGRRSSRTCRREHSGSS